MIPVLIQDILPNVTLQKYVRKYQVFRFVFDKTITPPIKHHYPRPEHCITFYIKDSQRFQYLDLTNVHPYPQCIINGMHTIPVHRHAGNDFLAIKAILQPVVLYQLLRFPLNELTNTFMDAEAIWGNEIGSVCNHLKELDDLPQMIAVIESFIESRMKKIKDDFHPIDKATDFMFCNGNISIDWLAGQSCLSVRQFIRKFEERIGISAKTVQRIIRFDNAYRMKNRHPEYDWLFIAISCNYYDYQHMVKDFKEFTNLTPCALYELELNAPERSFGFSYLT